MSSNEPGPFGWVGPLFRWMQGDTIDRGQGGPLPPPKARAADSTEHDIYQGLADGWLHGTVGASLSSFFSEPRTRKELYVLFEKMDMTDVAGSFLDLISEDATLPDPELDRRVWITGPDQIVAACHEMLERTKLEEEISGIARDTAKFGDDFERLVYRSGPTGGVFRLLPTPPLMITRKEDKEARLEGYLQTGKRFRNDNSEMSYPWDFVHFRRRGRDRRYPYGTSVLTNAIRPWKQLVVLEDWMLSYQVNRHPDRNAILLDIGSASEVEAADVTRKFRQKLKKHLIIDPAGSTQRGYMGYDHDPLTPMEDMVIPIRRDSATKIVKMSGSANALDIGPIQFVLDKFYAALRAPKSFFGIDYNSGMPMNMKASLTNQDIRYARAVRQLQQCVKAGIRFLCEMHLKLLMAPGELQKGVPDDGLRSVLDWTQPNNAFAVNMGPISFLEEMEQLEVDQLRQQVALAMLELGNTNPAVNIVTFTNYVLREIVKIPERDMAEMIDPNVDPEMANMMRFNLPPAAPGNSSKKESIDARSDVTHDQKRLIAEAVQKHRGLRAEINRASRIFRERPPVVEGAMLPDRDNELFRAGLLTDNITAADIAEVVRESGGVPGDGDE